jgi:hypothetical protein
MSPNGDHEEKQHFDKTGTWMTNFRFGRDVKPSDRHGVCWYHPLVLLKTAMDVLSSMNQFRNRDERESFALPLTVIDRSQKADDDFWFDFIADTGDGGNATYSVACTALADSVPGDGDERLMRGELLLFGGDLAYPSASALEYRYRFVEMYEAALPATPKPFTIAALPQNHDWMDSASTFGRYFLRNKNSRQFLGAEIPQQQSYFCVRLPHGWWVLGFDFAMTGDIDRDQFEQFASLVTQRIGSEDRVILIYPEPVWTTPVGAGVYPGGAKRYQLLEGMLQTRIALRLAGDLHHYMRWTSDQDGQLVTCGTGGAFCHPTHTRITCSPIVARCATNTSAIPASSAQILQVGIDDGAACRQSQFEKVKNSEFPPIGQSRRLAWGNIAALFGAGGTLWDGNRWFAVLMGVLYLISAGLNLLPFGVVLSCLLFAAFCIPIGWESLAEASPEWPTWRAWVVTLGSSALHTFGHVWAVLGLSMGLQAMFNGVAQISPNGSALLLGAGLLVTGALLGGLIFGLYLGVMSWLGWLTNNGYSALAMQDYKGFLRCKISPDGQLHAYFVAIDQVPKAWTLNKNQQPVWQPQDLPLASRVHDRFTLHKSNSLPST